MASIPLRHLGDGWFQVGLYDTAGNYTYKRVHFNGDDADGNVITSNTPWSADPGSSEEGEFWVTLYQRAYLQSRGLSLTNPPSGNSHGPLESITGRQITSYYPNFDSLDLSRLYVSVKDDGVPVTATTRSKATGDVSMLRLVPWHVYSVIDVVYTDGYWSVDLLKPHGKNSGSGWGDITDGVVRVSWEHFIRSMIAYSVSYSTSGPVSGGASSCEKTRPELRPVPDGMWNCSFLSIVRPPLNSHPSPPETNASGARADVWEKGLTMRG